MVAHHQAHQGYVAANGSVLVNGGTSAAGSRQLQGGQSSSSAATAAGGSRASQSGQSSQVPVMNHQPQREDNFDVSSLLFLYLYSHWSPPPSLSPYFLSPISPPPLIFSFSHIFY